MDKYEYKVRADEIRNLIAQGEYVQAAEIADTIDWRRVKSVMMLCTISDLYKINRRYEDAKNMLLLAYERRPGGRTICYSLCELSIKTEEYVQAVNYYKEFVQVAPKDPGRYILQYKLYEAQDVSLEERIGVLEELKKKDYREKWAYELAYLYHRVGLATRCVEECDELILWFGDGKYVIKAMELKMLHQPLTPAQQEKYDHRFDNYVQNYDQSAYVPQQETSYVEEQTAYEPEAGDTKIYEPVPQEPVEEAAAEAAPEQPGELDIQVKTMDMGQYNTINLQAEIAAGLREVLAEDQKTTREEAITRSIMAPMLDAETESLDLPEIDEVDENDLEPEAEVMESSEVFFGETGEIGDLQSAEKEPVAEELTTEEPVAEKSAIEELTAEEPVIEELTAEEPVVADATAELVMAQLKEESVGRAEQQVLTAQPPKELAGVLSQESDGQISLVVPESEHVEKQITGQMNIEDILAEWERMKQENAQKRQEEVRQHVLQQTGEMFTAFEAAVRDGLLEQLEGSADAENGAEETAEEVTGEPMEEVAEEAETVEAGEAYEEYPEENEDWDSIPPETEAEAEAEDDTEPVPDAETELVFEESDEVEEIEEIQEIQEFEDAQEPEEIQEIQELEDAQEPEEIPESQAETEMVAESAEEFIEEEMSGEPAEYAEAEETAEQEESRDVYEEAPVEREQGKVRSLTREEKELYAPFVQSRAAREQLVKAIDAVSMAAYTGNVVITGEEGMDTITLAKNMIREVQMTDSNFSGKVAKISGQALNRKDVEETLEQLKSGALIIQKASGMSEETAQLLYKALQQESRGIIIVLEDTRKAMNRLLENYPELAGCFTARMDVEALSNDTLVAFGRQYAREKEYSIDELGILALHTRIDELQTIDHAVTVMEVKEMVDNAIHHANRKTLGHFFDILFARRYDDEDMIVLSEKDFV